MGLLDFIERGPERSEWLSDTIGGAVEYLTPPNLRPVVEMAAQFNPIQGMSDSMSQFGVAVDPARSMDERRAAAMGSAVEGLLAVVPAAMASQGYMKPVQASMEGLLGWSPAGQAVGDELGRFVRSEGGSIGFDPVTQRGDEILDLLKRDPMRVTDDMLDMGADTPRLNEYLFRNYDLPMDQASRMARAEEMGFDAQGFHGSTHVFDQFGGNTLNPEGHFGAGVYVTSSPADASKHYAGEGPDLTQRLQLRAERIADDMGVEYNDPLALDAARRELSGGTDGIVYPVDFRRGNSYDISSAEGGTYVDMGFPELDPKDFLDEAGGDMEVAEELARDAAWDYEPEGVLADFIDSIQRNPDTQDANRMMEQLSDTGATIEGIRANYLDDIMRSPHALYAEDDFGNLTSNEVYRQALEDAGYNTVRHDANIFRGLPTDPDAVHDIIFDPTNIRSRFARFDPRLSHLKNLSAGIGAAGLFGLLSPQEQQGGI